jgi:hypothetical protein
MNRRDWLRLTLAGVATSALSRRALGDASAPKTRLTVYKSPTCGCCANWVEYMKKNGFAVDAHDVGEELLNETKATAGVPVPLRSCHVALAGGYAFEGHIPADLVTKVLTEKPKALGLAVPGMPAGSPGMEMGGQHAPYQVMAFDRQGKVWVFARR